MRGREHAGRRPTNQLETGKGAAYRPLCPLQSVGRSGSIQKLKLGSGAKMRAPHPWVPCRNRRAWGASASCFWASLGFGGYAHARRRTRAHPDPHPRPTAMQLLPGPWRPHSPSCRAHPPHSAHLLGNAASPTMISSRHSTYQTQRERQERGCAKQGKQADSTRGLAPGSILSGKHTLTSWGGVGGK